MHDMVNMYEMNTNTILNPTDMDLKLYMPRPCRLYVSTKFVLPVMAPAILTY